MEDKREPERSRTLNKHNYNCLIYSRVNNQAGLEEFPQCEKISKKWYVMRDLKRTNAIVPAYKYLSEKQIEVFTPMKERLITRQGKKVREKAPFLQDLLFVYETRENLDPILIKTRTLQYRFVKGGAYKEPMVIPENAMKRFIHAVNATENPQYYLPGEITPEMCGQRVRIIGGVLNNYEGKLLVTRGSKVRRLLVELPNFFSVGVEVNPEYIQFI